MNLRLIHVFFCFILSCQTFAAPQVEKILPLFNFPDREAAKNFWVPSSGVPDVDIYTSGSSPLSEGVIFPVDFGGTLSRCSWDCNYNADLTEGQRVSIRLHVDNPECISHFSLYFRAADGWWHNSASLKQGWQRLKWPKSSFSANDQASGWDKITGLRIAPWSRDAAGTATLTITEIKFDTLPLTVIEGKSSAFPDSAKIYSEIMYNFLDNLGLEYGSLGDDTLTSKDLESVSVVILPYNSGMPDKTSEVLEEYVDNGGRILAFFNIPDSLINKLGFSKIKMEQKTTKEIIFPPGPVKCLLEKVSQKNHAFYKGEAVSKDASIIGWWVLAEDDGSSNAAILWSDKGAWMTYCLLDDDPIRKSDMLLSLLYGMCPEIQHEYINSAISKIGNVGPYSDYENCITMITRDSKIAGKEEEVSILLEKSRMAYEKLLEFQELDDFCEVKKTVSEIQANLIEAYMISRKSEMPEFRAAWDFDNSNSSSYGDKEKWEKSMEALKKGGFNAIIPNMLRGGLAHFNSSLMPHSTTSNEIGDQLDLCVNAAKKYGIKVHPYTACWNCVGASQEYIDMRINEERTQVGADGDVKIHLCPSHPDNFKLMRDSILEMVDNYDIDGIHLDYIRYTYSDTCFCTGCLERFQEQTGLTVTEWPGDCYKDGVFEEEYLEWRREQINRLVETVNIEAKKRKPEIKISAAVFRNYPDCRESVAQDWKKWLEDGLIDFACPMNYHQELEDFRYTVEKQMSLVAESEKIYPGIGYHSGSSQLSPDQVAAQIDIARELGAKGFVLFSYTMTMREALLPLLVTGSTATPVLGCLFLLQ
jgi:uncharacterized lipoprotein YddW (UPF0748 family)